MKEIFKNENVFDGDIIKNKNENIKFWKKLNMIIKDDQSDTVHVHTSSSNHDV